MSEKMCWSCKLELPDNSFGNLKSSPDGLRSICKGCRKQYDDASRSRNREKNNSKARTYRILNGEEVRAKRREYRKANAKTIRKQQAAWRSANIEKVRIWDRNKNEKFRIKYRQRKNAYSASWKRANPQKANRYYLALSDRYVVRLLNGRHPLKPSEIPSSLIEAKRQHLKTHRLIKERMNEKRT